MSHLTLHEYPHLKEGEGHGILLLVLAVSQDKSQKCITGTQTFPIFKLSGWKHSTEFHKSFRTNRHQTLKHLGQYCCYRNRSVIGNRGDRWTFRNWGDIGLYSASMETTKTNKPPKHYTKTGGHNISSSHKKMRKYAKCIGAIIRTRVA